MEVLLKLGLVLVVGLIGGRLARIVKLPDVTGYLLSGLLLGPTLFNVITPADSASFSIINDVALAAIAFSIGSEFLIKDMKKLGSAIMIITLLEVVGAVFVVFGVMYFVFRQTFALSIVIASMSAATAPAATLMVIRQYRAAGPLCKTILPVVALDDVFGIIAFGIAMSLAKIVEGTTQQSPLVMFMMPLVEIFGSLALGIGLGFILLYVSRFLRNNEELLGATLAAIALASGIAIPFNLSPLLACIMLGTIIYNFKPNPVRFTSVMQGFTPPVYLLFFTLAGASLDLKILSQVGAMGIGYILARAAGKILGAYVGTKMAKSEPAVQRNLGLALLPQGGISIGLCVLVQQQLPQYATVITTIIMFSVLAFETSGPIFAKLSIQKAGEIGGMDKKKTPAKETLAQKA